MFNTRVHNKTIGVIGRKDKMGRCPGGVQKGTSIPVTFIEIPRCEIANVKTEICDGYNALEIKYDDPKTHRTKYTEFPVRNVDTDRYAVGTLLGHTLFSRGERVKVQGTIKGKGFLGNQKRNNFTRGPMTHGSKNHRQPGSIGAGSTPANVHKGKKMPGRLGRKLATSLNEIVGVLQPKHRHHFWVLIVKGAIPGSYNNVVKITKLKVSNGREV